MSEPIQLYLRLTNVEYERLLQAITDKHRTFSEHQSATYADADIANKLTKIYASLLAKLNSPLTDAESAKLLQAVGDKHQAYRQRQVLAKLKGETNVY